MAGYDVTFIVPSAEGDTHRDGVKICGVTPPRNRRERMTRTLWKVYRAALRANGEIYHFHDPELMPVGLLLRASGKRVIYDVHEDYATDMKDRMWLPPLTRWPAAVAFRICEAAFTLAFDRVIAVTPAIAGAFPPAKTRLVQNFPWKDEFRHAGEGAYEKREPIAVYVGGLADQRGMREMRQAVELAAEQVPIKLVIAGPFNPGARAEFQHDRESPLVEQKGILDRQQIAELLARARVGLAVYHPTINYTNSQPHKLFEYMAAGIPVVSSDFPHWRKLIGSPPCGLLVDPLNPAAIAEALVWLFRHPVEAAEMGRNGRRAIVENYNWEREAKSLISTYAELEAGA